ncbi:MAG: GntR family transcriptional regulator [Deltaproteobacteria bacterium]|nr:GntR family transcriptional regulator [Deltaproteobacteria bacterium]
MSDRTLQIELGQEPVSLKELAVQSIKKAIFDRKLKPENLYSDVAIAKTLGVSKTPVREALIDLASRGLLVHEPRRGFRIRRLTEEDVCSLYDYREVLEVGVVSRLVPKITLEGIEELEQILLERRKTNTGTEQMRSIMADRLFHLRLAEFCGNSFLLKAIQQVRDLCDVAGGLSLRTVGRKDEAQREHEALFEMIKRRSIKGAREAMEEHLRSTCRRVLQNL